MTPPLLFDLKGRRVFVAGHNGMAGSAILRRLQTEDCEILTADRQALDLTDQRQTEDWLAQHKPDIVVLELGANDALRGLPLALTEENLAHMAETAQKARAKVLLVGIQVPPNYGTDYANRFVGLYQSVAKSQGVADGPDALRLFQADRIHPTEAAQPLILDNIWPELKKLLPAPVAAGIAGS